MTSETMRLNTLSPAPGSRKGTKRVGRGIGSGYGKTCGRGHKGQKSRSGGSVRPGFEGGQMPLQRRLPKLGFNSRLSAVTAEIRLQELAKVDAEVVDMDALLAANLISKNIKRAKIIDSGKIEKAVSVKGLGMTKGARAAIEAAGGKVLED
jgi:large subunit ribosomal protein L15